MGMKKYYINEIEDSKYFRSDWNHRALGLFSESIFPFLPHWKGYGNVTEGKGSEYYAYCKLLAYGVQCCDGGSMYDTHRKFETVSIINKFHCRVGIATRYYQYTFFAENDEKAIDMFKQQTYNDKKDLGDK